MAQIQRFEDLVCWQKARMLTRVIYEISSREPLSLDYELRNQLRRAALSAMTNIAEGFARFHKKEFVRFLDIAQSSASEVKSLMYVVLDQSQLTEHEVSEVQDLAEECRRLALGLLRYVHQAQERKERFTKEPTVHYDPNRDDLGQHELPRQFFCIELPQDTNPIS